jgi:anthranilate phosphoribosyltransferase
LSNEFRDLLKKVGSGPHTGQNLPRYSAERAMVLMLEQQATPAQIGAFLIAHRIKRPTGEELAGFLDAFDQLGPKIPTLESSLARPVVVLGNPYDGRSRTAPLGTITALILASAGCPVLMHGGDCMPTKYGIPLVDVWDLLGVHWRGFSLSAVQQALVELGLGFVYLPEHFPKAQGLVPYRDQLGKRPPVATTELIWCPYGGKAHMFAGYVHPPTEVIFQVALHLRAQSRYTTIKGLEGSCDLPRDRTAIIGVHHPGTDELERLLLNARDYQLGGLEIPLESPEVLKRSMVALLAGQPSDLEPAALWNGGFYLWHLKQAETLEAGIERASTLLKQGQVAARLHQLQATQAALQPTPVAG